jgi:hypothetical protein
MAVEGTNQAPMIILTSLFAERTVVNCCFKTTADVVSSCKVFTENI